MKEFDLKKLLEYKLISEELNDYKIKKEKFNTNGVEYIDILIEIIKLYQRTLRFVYNQQKIANISINHKDLNGACNVLFECQDIINSALAMTDLDYEVKEPNIKFIDIKNNENDEKEDNKIINNLSDLENLVSKIINQSIDFGEDNV